MAKQSNSSHSKSEYDNPYSTPDVFTTSTGAKVRLIGLNQQRVETLRNAGKMPPKPFRVMVTDFGGEQKEELSESDLQTDEEKEQWRKYKEDMAEIERKRDLNVMRYTFTSGFEVIDLTDEKIEEWKWEEENVWENEVPDNKIDTLLGYINSKVIGNNDDYAEIMAGIMERSGVPADALDELRDSFRSQVRRNSTSESNEERIAQEQVEQ